MIRQMVTGPAYLRDYLVFLDTLNTSESFDLGLLHDICHTNFAVTPSGGPADPRGKTLRTTAVWAMVT